MTAQFRNYPHTAVCPWRLVGIFIILFPRLPNVVPIPILWGLFLFWCSNILSAPFQTFPCFWWKIYTPCAMTTMRNDICKYIEVPLPAPDIDLCYSSCSTVLPSKYCSKSIYPDTWHSSLTSVVCSCPRIRPSTHIPSPKCNDWMTDLPAIDRRTATSASGGFHDRYGRHIRLGDMHASADCQPPPDIFFGCAFVKIRSTTGKLVQQPPLSYRFDEIS